MICNYVKEMETKNSVITLTDYIIIIS